MTMVGSEILDRKDIDPAERERSHRDIERSNVLFGGPGPMLFTIYGRIVTPNPCYDLSAYRTLSGRELKITIVATPHPKGCASSIDHFDYQVLTDAPVCPHLTVWHHYDGSSLADVKVGELDILCGPAT